VDVLPPATGSASRCARPSCAAYTHRAAITG
jgi:hypothetical protein